MSHETHSTENKPKTALNASFWFVLILVGLFISAVNFIHIMGHEEPAAEHGAGHGAPQHATGSGHAAESHDTPAHDAEHQAH